MDTTVLTAAVIEHVGLHPVLMLIEGHIFVGYWRRDPAPSGPGPAWYPAKPVVTDPARIVELVNGGWLGVLETTVFTAGHTATASEARAAARGALQQAMSNGFVNLIDVTAARKAGVSPLPAVNERPDGVTEIVEYRPGGATERTEVRPNPVDRPSGPRFVDHHPPRFRTWKSSLFSLNATNALLNVGNGPSVQPVVLPPEGLGVLEDRLNQDVEFTLRSGFDLPEVYIARDIPNAVLMEPSEQVAHLNDRMLFVQRIAATRSASGPISQAKWFAEMRVMARRAKEAHDERGMNPLFLCLGMLRWAHKPGALADAPLILVPVRITARRGRNEFGLALDPSAHTTPNAALLEWLRREHDLLIPELAEPAADHAGIDVDGVLAAVRIAVAKRGLPFDVTSEAKLALLDLSAFRMWQDLHANGDAFLERPLVRHLVHTPTERFIDPAIATGDVRPADGESGLEKLETPIPADATQKTAVLWAREGRTFVLQGPPGTGKSQTITNLIAECLLAKMRVLFVAEKGTALSVVQRRLDAIGLTPFTLNLHHEGSSAAEVRAQLRRSIGARVTPDLTATANAQRRLRNFRFELGQYPVRLHRKNAAGLSAYSAHDELLVLGSGPTMPISSDLVTSRPELVQQFREVFSDLQPLAAAADVRTDHPWRFVGDPPSTARDVAAIATAVHGILDGLAWSQTVSGPLREALEDVDHPVQLRTLAAAADPLLPRGAALAAVLDPAWSDHARHALAQCDATVEQWRSRLHGYSPEALHLDLASVLRALEAATSSSVFGRAKKQSAALEPLTRFAPTGTELTPNHAAHVLRDLIGAQQAGQFVNSTLATIPGLDSNGWIDAIQPAALEPTRLRLRQIAEATTELRGPNAWLNRVRELAIAGAFVHHTSALKAYAGSWATLWTSTGATDEDFAAWRASASLTDATRRHAETWRRHAMSERLLPLQRWSDLVRYLEPLSRAGLGAARANVLEGRLPADVVEEAFARGLAEASERERVITEGLDHFDSAAHDQRVLSYAAAEAEVRRQWVTAAPARLLETRGSGDQLGGLARELEKSRNRLGTRAIMRRFGGAVQELTPLVLCSPSSAVDLIEPGVIDFDLVVFDEASQITVPEAVGAIGRARAVVVVGDSRQMPPTRKVGAQTASDEDLDDPDIEEVVEDQESILSECELARVPTLQLSWHYRSQDEALIAFSNAAYYGGELSSFPTPTLLSTETGVELRRIDGHFIRSNSTEMQNLGNGVVAGKATNPEEALAIVAAVREILTERRKPTIGIVTFNEQQRQLIEDLLRAADAPEINAAMDEPSLGPSDVLFVKALEQVQGDERDVVLFSIAFSKQASGRIPLNFGPLSNLGGERRLNVAVTRARRKNIVFCSFDPEELDADSASYNGVKDLKRFLLFTRAAGSSGEVATAPGRAAVRDRHRDEIAAALRDVGLHVMTDVGLSDFRLDLVVARAERPDRVLMPVLLDGESWRSRHTVSDRDVLPIVVLRDLMGWRSVARVWWPMWLQNRQEVVDRILTEVDRVEAVLDTDVRLERERARAKLDVPAPPPANLAIPRDLVVAPSEFARPSTPPPAAPAPVAPTPLATPKAPSGGAAVDAAVDALPDAQKPDVPAAPAAFVPAHTNVVGAREVLDALPDRTAADAVRGQLLDIVDAEGPIELGRLTRIVARRFGLNAVRAARAEEIARVIPKGSVRKGKAGGFVWPSNLDPAAWAGYRVANPDAPRTLDEIALEEIANSMVATLDAHPDRTKEEIIRRAAELFGITRLGPNVRARLELAYKLVATRSAGLHQPPAPLPTQSPAPSEPPSRPAQAPQRQSAASTLAKGGNLVVADGAPPRPARLIVGLGWDTGSSGAIEMDGSALALGRDGHVVDDAHFVFYGNRNTPDGAVTHRGGTSSVGDDREQITVELASLSDKIETIAFVVSIHEAQTRGHNFQLLHSAHIRVLDHDGQAELARFELIAYDSSNETAMVFGELYRRGAQWKFRAVGQGYESGLRGIATAFGVDVE
jgi:stress response protein SCP2